MLSRRTRARNTDRERDISTAETIELIAKTASIAPGLEELRQARRKSRGLYWAVALFSAFANVLMLTGPLYMLQVYDRVLSSRSVETLVALTALIAFLYVIMGVLDFARGRVLARIGARFQDDLDPRVFNAAIGKSSQGNGEMAQTALADLEAIQRFIASPGPTAGFDSFWTPVFLIGIAMFHPWLGYLALLGGGFLILLAALNQATSATPLTRAKGSLHRAAHLGEQLRAVRLRWGAKRWRAWLICKSKLRSGLPIPKERRRLWRGLERAMYR